MELLYSATLCWLLSDVRVGSDRLFQIGKMPTFVKLSGQQIPYNVLLTISVYLISFASLCNYSRTFEKKRLNMMCFLTSMANWLKHYKCGYTSPKSTETTAKCNICGKVLTKKKDKSSNVHPLKSGTFPFLIAWEGRVPRLSLLPVPFPRRGPPHVMSSASCSCMQVISNLLWGCNL